MRAKSRVIRGFSVPGVSVAVVPPKKLQEVMSTGLRVPKDLLERLDEIAKEEDYSRNEIIIFFLRWALKAYEAEKVEKLEKGEKVKRGH